MKAVRFDQYGGLDVLQVVDVDTPKPGPRQVLVQVKAAGINPGEAAIRSGAMAQRFPAKFPSGQGSDLAGVLEQVGTSFRGDNGDVFCPALVHPQIQRHFARRAPCLGGYTALFHYNTNRC